MVTWSNLTWLLPPSVCHFNITVFVEKWEKPKGRCFFGLYWKRSLLKTRSTVAECRVLKLKTIYHVTSWMTSKCEPENQKPWEPSHYQHDLNVYVCMYVNVVPVSLEPCPSVKDPCRHLCVYYDVCMRLHICMYIGVYVYMHYKCM